LVIVMKGLFLCSLQAWQRPTLPRLKTKYHWRWGDLRPSSRWDRVWTPRQSHQAGEEQRGTSTYGFGWREWGRPQARCLSWIQVSWKDIDNESDQADRTISTSKLRALLRFHTWPINVVVFHGSQGRTCFEVGFPLRCLQRLSRPHIATLHCRWRDNRSTGGVFIPVLSY
jgi:hypothetical protein